MTTKQQPQDTILACLSEFLGDAPAFKGRDVVIGGASKGKIIDRVMPITVDGTRYVVTVDALIA